MNAPAPMRCALCGRAVIASVPHCFTCASTEREPSKDELIAALDELDAQAERDEERESERTQDAWDDMQTYGGRT